MVNCAHWQQEYHEMTYEELIAAMTPEMHVSLKQAVELGKWPDGRRLSSEQRDICMRAVIAYDTEKLPPEARTGFIDRTKKDGSQHGADPLEPQTLKILSDAD
jgi:uncharacterized protein YeaC (DUF1315 family)